MKVYRPAANFSLLAPAYDLGGPRRLTLYAIKALQGAIMACVFLVPMVLVFGWESLGDPVSIGLVSWACFVVGVGEQLHALTDRMSAGARSLNLLGWACDLALAMAWTLFFTIPWRSWGWAALVVVAFVLSYPWSDA